MFTYLTRSALIFSAALATSVCAGDMSSDFNAENLSRFCPESTGQMGAHDCSDVVFRVKQKRAEDTGVEPATHCWAIDFESTC